MILFYGSQCSLNERENIKILGIFALHVNNYAPNSPEVVVEVAVDLSLGPWSEKVRANDRCRKISTSEFLELFAELLRRRHTDRFFVVFVEVAGITGSKTFRNVRRLHLPITMN